MNETGIEDGCIGPGAFLPPGDQGCKIPGFGLDVGGWGQLFGGIHAQPEIRWQELELADRPIIGQFGAVRGAAHGRLIHSFFRVFNPAVKNHRPLVSDGFHDPGHRDYHMIGVNPPYRPFGQGRVSQRGRYIQGGTETDLGEDPAQSIGMDLRAHTVEQADVGFVNAVRHHLGTAFDINAKGFRHIHRSADGSNGTGAMAGHADAAGCGDKRCRRTDIEGLERIHPRSAVFHHRCAPGKGYGMGVQLVNRLPCPGHFILRFAFGGQCGEKRALLHLGGFIFKHLEKCGFCFFPG